MKDLPLSSATRKPLPAGPKLLESSAPVAGRRGTNGSSGSTDHIKRVPQPKSLREQLRQQAALVAQRIDPSVLPKKAELDALARELLADLELPEAFVGWTMVMLASAFWQRKIISTPCDRRLLLLPGNLAHGLNCRAEAEVNGGVANGSKANGSAGARKAPPRQTPDCGACNVVALRCWPRGSAIKCYGPNNRSLS